MHNYIVLRYCTADSLKRFLECTIIVFVGRSLLLCLLCTYFKTHFQTKFVLRTSFLKFGLYRHPMCFWVVHGYGEISTSVLPELAALRGGMHGFSWASFSFKDLQRSFLNIFSTLSSWALYTLLLYCFRHDSGLCIRNSYKKRSYVADTFYIRFWECARTNSCSIFTFFVSTRVVVRTFVHAFPPVTQFSQFQLYVCERYVMQPPQNS